MLMLSEKGAKHTSNRLCTAMKLHVTSNFPLLVARYIAAALKKGLAVLWLKLKHRVNTKLRALQQNRKGVKMNEA